MSRTVVRQALAELETEGVIERVKGRGTFLAQHRTGESLVASLTGLSEDVAARGSSLRSLVQRLEVVPADEHVAAELEQGAPVVVLERLRFVDEEPWALVTGFLPFDLVPGLVHEDLSNRFLYALLEHGYGLQLRRGRRSVGGTVAGAALARNLGLSAGDPVLVLRSTVYGNAGSGTRDRPVEMFAAYHRGDRSRFEVNLTRSTTTSGPPEPLMRLTDLSSTC